MHKKTIDPVTGRMFLKHSLQDDARDKAIREEKRLKEHYGEVKRSTITEIEEEEPQEMKDVKENIIREMLIDNQQYVPNK